MSFDPLTRHYILLGCFLITCLKWSLVHFQIAAKMNFAPLSYQWLHRKSKVDQSSFWRQFESGPNFIFNTWSENSPIICNASKVDQNWFGMHIIHVIRSPSHSLLDQNSYHRVQTFSLRVSLKRTSPDGSWIWRREHVGLLFLRSLRTLWPMGSEMMSFFLP